MSTLLLTERSPVLGLKFADVYKIPLCNIKKLVAHKSRRRNSKFVKDQFNDSHESLMNACSLSASLFGKKSILLVIIILIFFTCALDERLLHVTLKYQEKPRTIA